MAAILVLNSGSSSVKFALYDRADEPAMLVHGQVRHLGVGAELILADGVVTTKKPVAAADPHEAIHAILPAIAPHLYGRWIAGVGHRIVHGGSTYSEPVELTPEIMNDLKALEPLAPLHQPFNLDGVVAAHDAFPDAVQIGCFDTAFHRGHPWVNDTFALPRALYDQGVRRYGFHGLSYDYVTQRVAATFPELREKRLVIAHLGNGASMCAVKKGKSVGSSMGFSALDGLPMGTRCGQLDPGVILYLMEKKGFSIKDLSQLLYKESGLLGLSGVSSEMQELLLSDRVEAAEAVDYFVFRARREVGAMAAVLDGIDALIFCGGIGENSPEIRARVVEGLHFLGLQIDHEKNVENAVSVGLGDATVLIVPTDEELVVARAVQAALSHEDSVAIGAR